MPTKFRPRRFVRRRRKPVAKRVVRRGRLAIPRGLRPAVHYFTRRTVESVNLLDPQSWPSFWGVPEMSVAGIAGTQSFKLADVPDVTDFTNLFSQYKLMGVTQQMYTSATNTDNTTAGNRQCMFMYKANPTGQTPVLTEEYFLTSQTSKTRTLVSGSGRPVRLSIPLKIHSALYGGVVTTSYAPRQPTFLDMEDTTVPHFGYQFRFQPVYNGAGDPMPSLYIKIITTYRIACKEVR